MPAGQAGAQMRVFTQQEGNGRWSRPTHSNAARSGSLGKRTAMECISQRSRRVEGGTKLLNLPGRRRWAAAVFVLTYGRVANAYPAGELTLRERRRNTSLKEQASKSLRSGKWVRHCTKLCPTSSQVARHE